MQHLLTERLIRKIFDNPEFTRRNVIAAEVEKVIDALVRLSFNRDSFLKSLDRFYRAIDAAAHGLEDFTDKNVLDTCPGLLFLVSSRLGQTDNLRRRPRRRGAACSAIRLIDAWQNDRMIRLQQVDIQFSSCQATVPPNTHLIEENLRAYVVLLSAHFQGFCRDLYTEAAMVIASKMRPALRLLIQQQFTAHRKLDRGNPNLQNLKDDFNCLGLNLDLTSDPCKPAPTFSPFPAVNIWEDADKVYVEAQLPGLDLKALEIYVTGGNQLTIKGERKQVLPEKAIWHHQERGVGSFARVLTSPFSVDANKVDARFENGVLLIQLAKHESSKPRKITVKAD